GGAGRLPARERARMSARDRRFGHAHNHVRQYQCADHDDRRKRRRAPARRRQSARQGARGMNSAARVKAILLDPAATWAVIAKDAADPAYILSRYVAVLALIPALSSFIGATLIGVTVPGGAVVRADFIDGLFGAVFNYVASSAMVLILAVIVNFAAPLFGGR